VLVVLLVPIVIALIPVLLHRSAVAQTTRVIAAVLMTVGVLLALASIGIFYVPALAALVTAAAIGHQRSAVRSV
jgi:hypothetical protein